MDPPVSQTTLHHAAQGSTLSPDLTREELQHFESSDRVDAYKEARCEAMMSGSSYLSKQFET